MSDIFDQIAKPDIFDQVANVVKATNSSSPEEGLRPIGFGEIMMTPFTDMVGSTDVPGGVNHPFSPGFETNHPDITGVAKGILGTANKTLGTPLGLITLGMGPLLASPLLRAGAAGVGVAAGRQAVGDAATKLGEQSVTPKPGQTTQAVTEGTLGAVASLLSGLEFAPKSIAKSPVDVDNLRSAKTPPAGLLDRPQGMQLEQKLLPAPKESAPALPAPAEPVVEDTAGRIEQLRSKQRTPEEEQEFQDKFKAQAQNNSQAAFASADPKMAEIMRQMAERKAAKTQQGSALTPAAQTVWDTAKAKKSEFEAVDTSNLSKEERQTLAQKGLSFTEDRQGRPIATYPAKLRQQDLRDKVTQKKTGIAQIDPADQKRREQGGFIDRGVLASLLGLEKQKRPGYTLDAPLVLNDPQVSGMAPQARPAPEQLKSRLENLSQKGVISPSELQVYKEQGLDKFLKTKPTVEGVAKWMQENGPKVEVKKFGEGAEKLEPEHQEFKQMTHEWLDSQPEKNKINYLLRTKKSLANANADAYEYANANTYAYANANAYVNAYANANADAYADTDADGYRNRLLAAKTPQEIHEVKQQISNEILEKEQETRAKYIAKLGDKAKRYFELHDKYGNVKDKSTAHWSFVAPKAEKDMPGYVEVAVTKPVPNRDKIEELAKKQFDLSTEQGLRDSMYRQRDIDSLASRPETREQFPSSHNYPPNTLGFGRGYMETLPSGEKVFHVVEVQSDWAQQHRDMVKESQGSEAQTPAESDDEYRDRRRQEEFRANKILQQGDPLLAHHENLVLKALIDHAREQGATHIAISDAETAMMSEGHDLAADYELAKTFNGTSFEGRQEAAKWMNENPNTRRNQSVMDSKGNVVQIKGMEKQIPQEKGMRLHYDPSYMLLDPEGNIVERFPSDADAKAYARFNRLEVGNEDEQYKIVRGLLHQAASQLTGEKGKVVDFGEHTKAMEEVRDDDESAPILVPNSDLIFRNPDNTTKTSVTARMYKIPTKGETPFSLFGKTTPKVTVGEAAKPKALDPLRKAIQERNAQGGSEAGSLYLGGLDTFIEQDVKPAIKKGVDAVKAAKDLFVEFLSPTSVARTRDVDQLFTAKGEKEAFMVKLNAGVEKVRKMFDGMKQADQIAFMDNMKTGRVQPTRTLQIAASIFREWDDAIYDEVAKYKPDLPYLENHARVLWKVIPGSQKRGTSKSNIGSHRPWQGSKGFLKKHTLDDMSEGIALGGVPVSYNPFELLTLHAQDAMKFVSANRAWDGLKSTGAVEYVKKGNPVPDGYEPIKDSISKVYFRVPQGTVSPGEYYVEKGAAKLINNFLGKDYIREGPLGPIGRVFMELKNNATMIELGFSPFHAFFISAEEMGSSLALAMSKMSTPGHFVEGVKELPSIVHSPLTTTSLGKRVEKMAKSSDMADFRAKHPEDYQWFMKRYPSAFQMLQDAFNGGAKIGLHEDFSSRLGSSFNQAARQGNLVGAAVRALPALNQTVSSPLFNKYIPRLKLGMFFREYAFELERNKADLISGKMTKPELARKVWNFIDDRFGEMNYDNLFWDRTMKSGLQLFFRSVTWKAGDLRAFGKGFRDTAKFATNPSKGMSLPMAWMMSMAITTALLSALITKFSTAKDWRHPLSGKFPWELAKNDGELLKNLQFPRVSIDNPNERVNIPTYWKDAVHLKKDPKKFFTSSLSEPVTRFLEDAENKDFFNTQIANPKDPLYKEAWDLALHMSPVPIGLSSFKGAVDQGKPMGQAITGAAGFPSAPSYETDSEALQTAKKIVGEKVAGVYTKENAEKRAQERKAVGEIRSGQEPVQEAVAKGEITKKDEKRVKEKASEDSLTYLVGHMGIKDAFDVWAKADQGERDELHDELRKKVNNSTLKLPEKQEYRKQLEEKAPIKSTTLLKATKKGMQWIGLDDDESKK